MSKLVKYVNRHRQGGVYNFQSLCGGKFMFKNVKTFVNLFTKEFPKLNFNNGVSLVFRPPKDCPCPFYLDLDLRGDTPIRIPETVLVNIAEELLILLKNSLPPSDKVWHVVLTKRIASYYKRGTVQKFCSGFHILIPNLILGVPAMMAFRKEALDDLDWFDMLQGYGITNPPDDILDIRVMRRQNGLVICGCNKPRKKEYDPSSPHYIFYINGWNVGWSEPIQIRTYGWMFENKTKHVLILLVIGQNDDVEHTLVRVWIV